ncbi:MAG TPA: hypothetical protein VHY58_22525 [Streptosporangiaceae bacterium]|nr:hypothetical protein [Streptosporangiaceae bacterium]
MRGGLTRSLLPLAALVLGLAAAPAASAATASAAAQAAQDPIAIGPNQYFKGIFNGHPPGPAIIFVACGQGGTTGHPVAGQKIWVKEIPTPVSTSKDTGFTGSKGTGITASLASATSTFLSAHFSAYGVKVKIPVSVTLPCSGSGAIAFAPIPKSKTAHTAVLNVTFGPPPAPGARG